MMHLPFVSSFGWCAQAFNLTATTWLGRLPFLPNEGGYSPGAFLAAPAAVCSALLLDLITLLALPTLES